MPLRTSSTLLLALFTLLASPFVLAHSAAGYTAGLADGFMHPATGIDHLLFTITAGFWAGRSGDHGLRDVGYFLLMLLGGILLGWGCVLFPQLQLSTILAVVLTVAFLAASIAKPQYFLYIFFGGFAVYHGIAHVLDMQPSVTGAGYIPGLIISTWLLLMLGLILRQVVVTRKPHA